MLGLMDYLVDVLPAPLRRHVAPGHVQLLAQMAQFGLVGFAGFLVNTAVVYGTRGLVGLYVAGVLAYGAAATATWWLNRNWTFRGASNLGPIHRQWVKFVLVNIPGLCLNLGMYFALISFSQLCRDVPVIAISAGAIAGMTANFLLSRAVVFR